MHCVAFVENASFKGTGATNAFLMSSRWTKETAMASFQEDQCVDPATGPITRLIHHWIVVTVVKSLARLSRDRGELE